jgi:hypothetical protein
MSPFVQEVLSIDAHPGGVSCLDVVHLTQELASGWLVASGGDDNTLILQLFAAGIGDSWDVKVVSSCRNSASTACQIVGEAQCVFIFYFPRLIQFKTICFLEVTDRHSKGCFSKKNC